MLDTEIFVPAGLTSKMYDKIEELVVSLYEDLKIENSPINPFKIAEQKGYILNPYSKIAEELRVLLRNNGMVGTFVRTKEGIYKIFYDDSDVQVRQRFTIMHEIGHIVLGHKENSSFAEKCANYYASYSLSPTPLIGVYDCEDFIDVSTRFNISYESAIYAFNRYMKWLQMPNDLKPYEIKLKSFFE